MTPFFQQNAWYLGKKQLTEVIGEPLILGIALCRFF
jgi:hypothetical protein